MSSTPLAAQSDVVASAGFFPNLMRELATAAPVDGRFAPILTATDRSKDDPAGQMCARCCRWSLPLSPPYIGRDLPHGVAMLFHEWLVWHLHVVTHQTGALA